ncbi:BgTH12-02792 [Blumeria graminis f. sp. triticale]|uniref:U3 small nucleolar RNA-associated protein 22 n=1 Tax=Blumeria graminis f. sp. triticale TaxID=1689686 RepID=A0A9W4GFS5_BLUGR|nr:BgTH12-02792 [Blumeria graminis f. sp. triticale]
MDSNSAKRRKLDCSIDSHSLGEIGSKNFATTNNQSHENTAPEFSEANSRKPLPHTRKENLEHTNGSKVCSIFTLQADELLAEVEPNYEKEFDGVNDVLHRLKGLIENIEARQPLSVNEANLSLEKEHKIRIPYSDPKPDQNAAYKLAYEKPLRINIVGSYPTKIMVKSKSTPSIDLIVVMPDSIFQSKDFLNYRYFYKRAYYLACISAGLSSSPFVQEFDLRFEYFHGNDLHPVLVVSNKKLVSENSNKYPEIRILPAVSSTAFNALKLRPNKNAIRSSKNNTGDLIPTPFYNASLRSDCNYEPYLKIIHVSEKKSQAFCHACMLGRIWLSQRGFNSTIPGGGFGNFEWAALTSLLLKGGGPKSQPVLSHKYTSNQMFKALLQFLSANDFAKKPFMYHTDEIILRNSHKPIFFDGPREQNILYKMTPWSYNLLQEEVRLTLESLSDETFDNFDSTFIIKSSQHLLRFDSTFTISQPNKDSKVEYSDHLTKSRKYCYHLFDILRQGLTDRIKMINIHEPTPVGWSITTPGPNTNNSPATVSVTFDAKNIDRLVDHGPQAEDKAQAASFRRFWGEKSELRRFKDGSILETLVWSPGSTQSIFENVLSFILGRHCGLETVNSLKFLGNGLEKLLPKSVTDLKPFEPIREAFRLFETQVRGLEGLPLQIKQISGIDPRLRYTSFEIPAFNHVALMMNPVEVLIEFEGSGRWPDNILAIQRSKVAFLLKISTLLENDDSCINARLGIENEFQKVHNCAFLDVTYESGASFRLRIYVDREITLLQQLLKDESLDQFSREDALSGLSNIKRNFIQLLLHSQSIHKLCTRFPLLSATIRLVKHWFNCHMLLGHLREEVVEMIVTHIFLRPYPWRSPSSVMTAFFRTMLYLSRWDWRSTPLIIDYSGEMGSDVVDSIKNRLEAWRKIDPGLNRCVLFVASNHDSTGMTFSDQGPSKMIAARMTSLARSAYKLIREKSYDLDPASLFSSSIADYDFVIHLSSTFANGHLNAESRNFSKFKNVRVQSNSNLANVGYQAIQLYLNELERIYTNHIIFFYGDSSSVITGLWNPTSLLPRSFKVNLSYSSCISEKSGFGKDQIVINKNSILAEIARLGGDMVSKISLKDLPDK